MFMGWKSHVLIVFGRVFRVLKMMLLLPRPAKVLFLFYRFIKQQEQFVGSGQLRLYTGVFIGFFLVLKR